ncbi:MAG: acylneuraminate cytidylyltransferase family protein [Phycisphaeraceae bacterium]|nr:acylneuraminate cytidylyltransferase family protein [Phycisphaeraceae bacterium]
MKTLGIILARGGSKGVPGKNIAPVAGRPCLAWTIDAARESRALRRTVVSSDDARILCLAEGLGVEALRRDPSLATDNARVDDAARDALRQAEERHGERYDAAVILYANVPVRPAGLIDRAVALLRGAGCDSVQSFARVGKHHPWWMARLDGDARLVPWTGDTLFHGVFRRQELPPAHVPDGGVMAVTRRALVDGVPGVAQGPHAFLGVDRRAVVTSEGDVVDIDTPLDLRIASAVLEERRERAMSAARTPHARPGPRPAATRTKGRAA